MPSEDTGRARTRMQRAAASAVGLALLLAACLLPASAGAAAQLQVELTHSLHGLANVPRTDERVYRSDQRVDYEVTVSNAAPVAESPQVGETMTCEDGQWGGSPTFTYRWLRNGDPIGSAEAKTYEAQAADVGAVIQCRVIGTNAAGAAVRESLPTLVVGAVPAAGHPNAPRGVASLPRITPEFAVTYNETTEEFQTTQGPSPFLTCTAPGNWTGPGLTWSFRWLRNGVDVGTANVVETTPTTSKYELQLEDRHTVMQCRAVAEDENGLKAVKTSIHKPIEAPGFPAPQTGGTQGAGLAEAVFPAQTADDTVGPVTVEIELPGGLGTFVERIYNPIFDVNVESSPHTPTLTPGTTVSKWSCAIAAATPAQPATVTCQHSNPLPAGAAYPAIAIATGLGADAPDLAVATATVSGGGAPDASALEQFEFLPAMPFGIEAFKTAVLDELGAPYSQAGGHPFSAGAEFAFNTYRELTPQSINNAYKPIARTKTVRTETPRGFVGNALAIEGLCPSVEVLLLASCPAASGVGGISLAFADGGLGGVTGPIIFAIEPEFGRPAQFAFTESLVNGIYIFYPKLRPEDGYAITLESAPLAAYFPTITWVDAELCSFGVVTRPPTLFDKCKQRTDPTANLKPLVTLPTRCDGVPPTTRLAIDSWQNQGHFVSKSFSDPPLDPESCEKVPFEPEMELEPTSSQADSPTGMDVEIFMPTDGLESNEGISQANLKQVKVTLPQGMAVNASAGHGLLACSAAQVGMHPVTGVPNDADANCPEASKIGTIGITTPLIQEKLTGEVYIAKQGADNPFDSNIALYMVFFSKKDGVTIKLAGEVKPDPVTGQMEIVFDDNPEAPFSSVEMHFPAGPRANLVNPPRCGSYEIKAELSPWTGGAPVTTTSTYNVTSGPGGGPCPDGRLDPQMNAGTTSPVAGKPSPFVMRLTREDGTQRFTALDLSTPRGLVASLRGIPYCPDEVLASISPAAETGQAQIDNPSCPAASLVGHASAGAGAGPNPLYVNTGRAYLAGPYKGAPLSLALVTPAVAGPIDLGNVVVRTALHVNPETAQITAISDPIPHILHGILLGIRDIRVAIDRPNFAQNPTSCAEMSVDARVSGDGGASANLSNRFQAMECAGLGFAPRVNLRLVGGSTKRGGHPSLRAVVRPRPGDANIRRAAVTMPTSAFLDQANIRTICTRVQWAEDNCPKAARYGHARAWSPLLDQPLKGPVYLRSSSNLLPDLVADLRGPAHQPIKIEASFRTDSVRGALRSTIDLAPDAPVSRFLLRMQGGKRKGLIVNSRDICRGTNRANSRMIAHNGRRANARPKVHAPNCDKARKGAKGKGSHQARVNRMKAVKGG